MIGLGGAKARQSAYRTAFASDAGQSVLRDLVRRFGYLNRTTIVPGDAISTAYQEGQRSVIAHILRVSHADPCAMERLVEDAYSGDFAPDPTKSQQF